MSKKLLILGATAETCKIVQTAEKKGIETYVVDPYPKSPAKSFSSHPVDLDCYDIKGVCDLIYNYNIDAILPGCADILINTYNEVCKKTGLYCYVNDKIVEVFNNKQGLKRMLKKHDIDVINEYSYDEAVNIVDKKHKLFVKPLDNACSRGMSVVSDKDELDNAIIKAKQNSRLNNILIEDYKMCDDFFIGYFIENGNVHVTFTGDRYVINQYGCGSITSAITYPSKYRNLYFETLHNKMLSIFTELNFTNGILAIQGFVENNKILFYDPALRITGGQEYLFCNHFYKLDELEELINFAIYGKMGNNYTKIDDMFAGKCGCNLAISVMPCIIGRISGVENAANNKNILNITQEHKPGDKIAKIGTAEQNVIRMHIFADNKFKLCEIINYVRENIKVVDDDDSNVIIPGFNPNKWIKGE